MSNKYAIFEPCCAFLIRELEGLRFTNTASDRGGPTAFGITKPVYDAFRDAMRKPRQSVGSITWPEASEIYRLNYWNRMRCPELDDPLRMPLFQWAVNHGVGGATISLQECLGMEDQDEKARFGKLTMAALQSWDPPTLAAKFLVHQLAWYDEHVLLNPDQAPNKAGWHNRVFLTAEFIGLQRGQLLAA